MKHYPKPITKFMQAPEPKAQDLPLSEISVSRLIDDGLVAIHREMRNLLIASSKGKLPAADSRDLRDLVKLLFELKDREDALLKGMTDEQLKSMVTDETK
jgi:hypothetical protein